LQAAKQVLLWFSLGLSMKETSYTNPSNMFVDKISAHILIKRCTAFAFLHIPEQSIAALSNSSFRQQNSAVGQLW